MTTIGTFCKVNPASSSNQAANNNRNLNVITNKNKIEFPNEGKFFEFDKVFGVECHENSEVFSLSCSGLMQAFVNGYNTALLLLGNVDCLKAVLFENKGLLTYLVEHVTQLTGKELKNQKEVSGLVYMTTPPPSSSKVRHEVTLKLYQVNGNQVSDLLGKAQSSPARSQPSFTSNLSADESLTQNLFEHPIVGTSSKRSIKLLNTAFQSTKFSSLENIDHTSLIIEFCLSKFLDGCSKPLRCWFRTVVIPTDPLQDVNDTGKPLDMLTDVVHKHFANNCTTKSSQQPASLKDLLCELIGGNCCVNSLTCINHFVSPVMLQLMKLTSSFKQITNFPVPVIPQVELLLKSHRDKIQRLQAAMKKEQSRDELLHNEIKEKLDNLSVAHEKVKNEKGQLEIYVNELQQKYSVLFNLHAETSTKNNSTAAEKLQITKEMVDMKLRGNHIQQEAEKSLAVFKKKLLSEEEKSAKLHRDVQFERRMHEELKSKHKHLQTVETDLSEEYVNLKLNYQRLKSDMEGQTKVITELRKTVTQLLNVKSQITSNSTAIQQKQSKKFKEDLQKLSSLLSDIPNRKSFEWERRNKLQHNAEESKVVGGADYSEELLTEHRNELVTLEDKLFSVRKQLNEKEEAIGVYKHKLAEVSSHYTLTKKEKDLLRRRLVAVETTFQHLSHQYQERLEQYIKNINEYVASKRDNNEEKLMEANNLGEDTLKMVSDLREAHKNERNESADRIKVLSESNEKLFERCMKLMVAYRLLLGNSGNTVDESLEKMAAIPLDLPDDVYVSDHQFQKIKELESKLKAAENDIRNLEEKIDASKPLHVGNNSKKLFIGTESNRLWKEIKQQIQNNSKLLQQTLEREKAQLLTRCTVAEQHLESYKEMRDHQTARYEAEISYLHDVIERRNESHDVIMHRPPQQPLPIEHRGHQNRRVSPTYPPPHRSRYQHYADRLNQK